MLNVYIADVTGLEDLYEEKLNMLHRARADKLTSYRMKEDKVRALGAGLLIEKGLEDYLQSAGEQVLLKDAEGRYIIEYGYGPQGKPYFRDFPNLHFSLSHSGELVVLAIADDEIGIDVQQFRGFQERIAKRFFHEREVKLLESVSDIKEKEILFYKIWTSKEGYIKYTGEGMRRDLRSFYYNQGTGTVCNDGGALARCEIIPLQKDGYFCSLIFHEKLQKIDKIIKKSI